MCFLAATCAYDIGLCHPARFFVAGPSFVLAVETLRRKIERSNLVAHQPARDRRCRRIKYHNAPGTSIGIRCNQFGRGPKAAACKSSLQGIGIGDTDGNQTPPRGQWSDLYTSIPYELDFLRTRCRWKLEKPFRKTAISASDMNIEVSSAAREI